MTSTLPMIDVGIWPLRSLGGEGRGIPALVRWVPTDYFESPLTIASFFTGPSDYDTPSNELYCPCNAILDWDDYNLGTAVEAAEAHIAEAHPEATAKARAKRLRDCAR